jgi:hypothetical protein
MPAHNRDTSSRDTKQALSLFPAKQPWMPAYNKEQGQQRSIPFCAHSVCKKDKGSGSNALQVHKHEIFFFTFFAETETIWSQGPVTRDF